MASLFTKRFPRAPTRRRSRYIPMQTPSPPTHTHSLTHFVCHASFPLVTTHTNYTLLHTLWTSVGRMCHPRSSKHETKDSSKGACRVFLTSQTYTHTHTKYSAILFCVAMVTWVATPCSTPTAGSIWLSRTMRSASTLATSTPFLTTRAIWFPIRATPSCSRTRPPSCTMPPLRYFYLQISISQLYPAPQRFAPPRRSRAT